MLKRHQTITPAAVRPLVDRRMNARYVGPINGSYMLSDRRSLPKGSMSVYACRSDSMSPSAASVTAPVRGGEGEWLTARFDGIGIIRGLIEKLTQEGFIFQIVASDEHRAKLAAKIDWLRRHNAKIRDDKRRFERFVPRDPRSAITFADGVVAKCFVIDISRSGAAVSAQHRPEIGASVVLGTLACHVIRHLDVGFAVEFDAAQDAAGLEDLVTGFEPKHEKPNVWVK
ncbi:MAG: PilZ domain-containing protein [Devosia sp.]